MLRLRIDLTACGGEFKDVFWRLERNGIFHKTVSQYATQLLHEYGVKDGELFHNCSQFFGFENSCFRNETF